MATATATDGMATATDGMAKIGDGKALLWKHSNGKAWRGFVLQRQGLTLQGKGMAKLS